MVGKISLIIITELIQRISEKKWIGGSKPIEFLPFLDIKIKIMKNFVLFFLIVLLSSCKQNYSGTVNLTCTKWISHVSDNYYDSIIFIDSNNYRYYSCETDETFYGNYKVSKNEIYLHQIRGSYDDESESHSSNVKFKLILKNKKLYFSERWEKDNAGKWEKSNFKFSEDYYFQKIPKNNTKQSNVQ